MICFVLQFVHAVPLSEPCVGWQVWVRTGACPPAPELFQAQAQAIECWHSLVQSGDYTPAQMRLFAEETFEGGKRRFLVDTFAGFTLA